MAKSKTKNSKSESSKKGASIDALLARVSEASTEAERAESKADAAARKADAKKKSLKGAKANAAAARIHADKAAAELRVAEDSARAAVDAEKTASKEFAKAKKKRQSAENKAAKAASEAQDAQKGLAKEAPGGIVGTKKNKKDGRKADGQKPETPDAILAQIVGESDAHADSVPTELTQETVLVPVDEAEIVPPVSADQAETSTESGSPEKPAEADRSDETSEQPAEETPTSDWTLVRLRALARERSVRGYSGMSKARLLDVLKSGESQPSLPSE